MNMVLIIFLLLSGWLCQNHNFGTEIMNYEYNKIESLFPLYHHYKNYYWTEKNYSNYLKITRSIACSLNHFEQCSACFFDVQPEYLEN